MVDLGIMRDLEDLIKSQADFVFKYKGESYLVEPYGKEVEIWKDGEKLGRYCSLSELLETFRINGILMIECLDDIELDI